MNRNGDNGRADSGSPEHPENRAVHAFLSLLGPGEADAIDARVDRALAGIDQVEAKESSRRRIVSTLVASLTGIAAMIVLLVIIYPRTESVALAQTEISTLVEQMKANTDRWYFIEVGRPELGSRRGLYGELYVTSDGKFVAFTYHRGPGRQAGPVIGDDGDGIWILPPDGERVPSHAIPKMLSDIMPRVAEGGLDPASLLQLAQDDWTLHREILNVSGRKIIRIEAISPPMMLPTRFPPKPMGPNRMDRPPGERERPPIGPPGSLNPHVERLLIDIDPETSEFLRLEVSRKIDGLEFPGAFMRFTRDDGQRPPPGLSPGQYELGPGRPPLDPFGGPRNGEHNRFQPGRPPLGPGPGREFRNDPF